MQKLRNIFIALLCLMLLYSGCQNPVLNTSETQARSVSGCQYPDYEHGTVYHGGDIVHHANADYKAKWWTQNEYPPGTSGVWEYLNPCDTVQSFTITTSINDSQGGIISPAETLVLPAGSNQSFTVTSNTNYEITGIHVNGVRLAPEPVGGLFPPPPLTEYTFTIENLQENTLLEISFSRLAPTFYYIDAKAGVNGTIDPVGSIQVASGNNMTFNIIPNAGYIIADVIVNDTSVGPVSSYTFTNIQSHQFIEAKFRLPGPSITVTASAREGGSISPVGITHVDAGESVTYTITAGGGNTITDLIVNGESVLPTSWAPLTKYQHTISNIQTDSTIEAVFNVSKPVYHDIAITTGPNGTASPIGIMSVRDGRSLDIYITPDVGYRIDQLTVDGQAAPVSGNVFTLENIRKRRDVHITFSYATTFIINSMAGANGSITPSGYSSVAPGHNFTFMVKADSGYVIKDVTVDGVSVIPDTSFDSQAGIYIATEFSHTIYNVNADTEINAVFGTAGPEPWYPGVNYTLGDQVAYAGYYWTCQVAHVSNASWYPGAPGLWIWKQGAKIQ